LNQTSQTISTVQQRSGENTLTFAWLLNEFGRCQYKLGHYSDAEPLIKRALEIRERLLPPDDLDFTRILRTLALIYSQLNRFDESRALYSRDIPPRTNKAPGFSRTIATLAIGISQPYPLTKAILNLNSARRM
jgi:tetratricopeptide (TPR) repeat protein